jgi:hypothetical protein
MAENNSLTVLAATVTATLGIVAGFNVLVDPKGVYEVARIEGFNASKAYQSLYIEPAKAHASRRYQPDTVMFGASPIMLGLVPECRAPAVSGVQRIYNYGGAGYSVYSFPGYYADLRAAGAVKRLAIEVRLPRHKFIRADGSYTETPRPSEHATGMFADAVRPWLPADHAGSFLSEPISWSGVALGFQTVAANMKRDQSFVSRGFEPDGSYDQQWLQRRMPKAISEQSLVSHIANYDKLLVSRVTNDLDIDLAYVDQLAELASRDGAALDVFITPEHASELLLYHEGGIWPLYEKLKRGLVQAGAAAQARYGTAVRVFDLGTFSEVSTQPVHQNGAAASDTYFNDPVHYKRIVGDFVLATIFGCQIDEPAPPGFASELSSSNIEPHLADQRARLDRYRQANGDVVRAVAGALRQ